MSKPSAILTKHGVLTTTSLHSFTADGKRVQSQNFTRAIENLDMLWFIAQQQGITHFWVMPGSTLDVASTSFLEKREGWHIFATYNDDGLPKFVNFWKEKEHGHQVFIGYAHNGDWGWQIEQPMDILVTTLYLERELKVPVQWSPGAMGFAMVKRIHANDKHHEWVRESTIPLKTLPFKALPVMWHGSLDASMIGKYLHLYDKNSAYISACRGVQNGCGTPVHVTGQNITTDKPGTYHVRLENAPAPFDGELLPHIFQNKAERETADLWVTRDVLKYAIEQGYKVEIEEAYIFEESHRILDKWAGDLWETRAKLDPEHGEKLPYQRGQENAYRTIKRIAHVGVGRFGAKEFEHDFMRRNWWAEAVGGSREKMLRNFHNWYTKFGIVPSLCYDDGVWIASDEKDAKAAVPGILDRADKLGGYKHVYTVLITAEMVEKFTEMANSKRQASLVSYLHKCAKFSEEE